MEQVNTISATTSAPNNPTPSGKIQGWVIILVILLFLVATALAAGVALLLMQTPNTVITPPPVTVIPETIIEPETEPAPADPTARWKTYNNEELGIAFKHPSDWAVKFVAPTEWELGIDPNTIDLQVGEVMNIKRGHDKVTFIAGMKGWETVENPEEMPPVIINGSVYKFTKVRFGEGGYSSPFPTCSQTFLSLTYYFEIEEDVVVIEDLDKSYCGESGEQLRSKTTVQDLEIARLIAESISFIE
jgi:hypothetical protein